MSCGPNPLMAKLKDAEDAAKKAFDSLTDGADGIMGSLDSLAGDLDAQISGQLSKLKEAMPSIELPDLGSVTLPELNLPEIKAPKLSLQNDIKGLIGADFSNPLTLLELESIKEKFKDSGVDFDTLSKDLISGKINVDNLCKLVPDVAKKEDGSTEKKGTPATAPSEAGSELAKEVEAAAVADAEAAMAALEGNIKLDEVTKKLETELNAAAEELDLELKSVTATLGIDVSV